MYGQQPQYGGDPWAPGPVGPPPKKGGSGLLVAVIVVLAVLVCGGGATGVYLLSKNGKKNTGSGATTGPTAAATATATTGPSPTPAATTNSPTPDDTNGARDAKAGDCLKNEGTNDAPKMRKVPCAAGTYEVLKRFDGTADTKKCDGVPGYQYNYYYDSTVNSFDFVLCMKQR